MLRDRHFYLDINHVFVNWKTIGIGIMGNIGRGITIMSKSILYPDFDFCEEDKELESETNEEQHEESLITNACSSEKAISPIPLKSRPHKH